MTDGNDRVHLLYNLFDHLMGDPAENSCMMVDEVTPIADFLQFGNHPFYKCVGILQPLG
jgi:hypothetical protein